MFATGMPGAHGVSNQTHLWIQKSSGRKVEKSATVFVLFLTKTLGYYINSPAYHPPKPLVSTMPYTVFRHLLPLGVCKMEKKDKDVKSPRYPLADEKKNCTDPLLAKWYP